jgi:hypothetical protein
MVMLTARNRAGEVAQCFILTSTGNGHAAITGTAAKGTTGTRAITITAYNQLGNTTRTLILTIRRP